MTKKNDFFRQVGIPAAAMSLVVIVAFIALAGQRVYIPTVPTATATVTAKPSNTPTPVASEMQEEPEQHTTEEVTEEPASSETELPDVQVILNEGRETLDRSLQLQDEVCVIVNKDGVAASLISEDGEQTDFVSTKGDDDCFFVWQRWEELGMNFKLISYPIVNDQVIPVGGEQVVKEFNIFPLRMWAFEMEENHTIKCNAVVQIAWHKDGRGEALGTCGSKRLQDVIWETTISYPQIHYIQGEIFNKMDDLVSPKAQYQGAGLTGCTFMDEVPVQTTGYCEFHLWFFWHK